MCDGIKMFTMNIEIRLSSVGCVRKLSHKQSFLSISERLIQQSGVSPALESFFLNVSLGLSSNITYECPQSLRNFSNAFFFNLCNYLIRDESEVLRKLRGKTDSLSNSFCESLKKLKAFLI